MKPGIAKLVSILLMPLLAGMALGQNWMTVRAIPSRSTSVSVTNPSVGSVLVWTASWHSPVMPCSKFPPCRVWLHDDTSRVWTLETSSCATAEGLSTCVWWRYNYEVEPMNITFDSPTPNPAWVEMYEVTNFPRISLPIPKELR